MPFKTITGKKFILVAKSVVGKTTGTFPDKKVTISGKGEKSGKQFSTMINKFNNESLIIKVDINTMSLHILIQTMLPISSANT